MSTGSANAGSLASLCGARTMRLGDRGAASFGLVFDAAPWSGCVDGVSGSDEVRCSGSTGRWVAGNEGGREAQGGQGGTRCYCLTSQRRVGVLLWHG